MPFTKKQDYGEAALRRAASFRVAGNLFLADVMTVREVVEMTTITRVAGYPDGIDGIIHLRGLVIPIISLSKSLDLAAKESTAPANIIIVELASGLAGFAVDLISDVIYIENNIERENIGTTPWFTGITHVNGEIAAIIDLAQVAVKEGIGAG